MSFSLTGILATALVLSIMVFIHELGHFIAAKLFKVRVQVFSIGFGKRLFGYKHGDTDYRVSILPLGGYVMMGAELPDSKADGTMSELTQGPWDELSTHPRWQRIIIALAGPFANFALAIALLTGVYMVHDEVPKYMSQPVVLDYVPANSAAAKAGFRNGDQVVNFDGIENPNWEQFSMRMGVVSGGQANAVVEREGQRRNLSINPPSQDAEEDGFLPRVEEAPLKVETVVAGWPAAKAGIQPGDLILSVNDIPVHFSQVFIQYLQDQKGAPVDVAVERNGQTMHTRMTPELNKDAGGSHYQIGVGLSPPPMEVQKQGFGSALQHSVSTNIQGSTMIFDVLRRMFTFRMSPKNVDGPIGIWRETSRAVQMPGWTPLVVLMAVISLNLGIMNLLPFPILDGGAILLLIIEGIMRHDLNARAKERIYQGAFVVLIIAFALIIFNDLTKLNLFHHGG